MEVKIPKDIRRWVKLSCGCCIDGRFYVLPGESKNHFLSCIGLGKTVDEAITNVEKVISKVEAFQLQKSFDKNAILDKIKEGEKSGIKF